MESTFVEDSFDFWVKQKTKLWSTFDVLWKISLDICKTCLFPADFPANFSIFLSSLPGFWWSASAAAARAGKPPIWPADAGPATDTRTTTSCCLAAQVSLGDVHSESKLICDFHSAKIRPLHAAQKCKVSTTKLLLRSTYCLHFLHLLLPASVCFLLPLLAPTCTTSSASIFLLLLLFVLLLLLPVLSILVLKLPTDLQMPVNAQAPMSPMLYYCVGFVNAENVQQADYMGWEPQSQEGLSSRKRRLSKVVQGLCTIVFSNLRWLATGGRWELLLDGTSHLLSRSFWNASEIKSDVVVDWTCQETLQQHKHTHTQANLCWTLRSGQELIYCMPRACRPIVPVHDRNQKLVAACIFVETNKYLTKHCGSRWNQFPHCKKRTHATLVSVHCWYAGKRRNPLPLPPL